MIEARNHSRSISIIKFFSLFLSNFPFTPFLFSGNRNQVFKKSSKINEFNEHFSEIERTTCKQAEKSRTINKQNKKKNYTQYVCR